MTYTIDFEYDVFIVCVCVCVYELIESHVIFFCSMKLKKTK
jgi:hypothetical protein